MAGFPGGGSGGPPAVSFFSVGPPANTISASGVMMGLGATVKFTPTKTGKLLLILQAMVTCAIVGVAPIVQVNYGTGAAPANGAAIQELQQI